MRRRRALIVVLALAIGGVLLLDPWTPPPARRLSSTALPIESNILPGDYVGPETCRECHEENYDLWSKHPHSRMNQDASASTVMGDFSGVRVAFGGGHVVFSREGDDHVMTLERAGAVVRRYRVTRTVGSRFMQMFIGVQTVGPEPADHVAYTAEQKLPFGYWFRLKRWLPTSFFDPPPSESAPDGTLLYDPFDRPRVHLWQENCMFCHNTYPYAFRLLGAATLAGFPMGDLHVSPSLASAVAPVASGSAVTLKVDHLVTLGISCESCHFGGRAHAREDHVPRFLPTSPHLALAPEDPRSSTAPERTNPYAVNGICAQCHSAAATLYPNGCATLNSREALDQRAGACQTAIRCTDCHDPHVASGPSGAPDAPEHLQACVRCHAGLAGPAHSRHAPGSASCLDCHMPRVTQGLDEVVRTHHISSPTDPSMLAAGAPNACNLCHLDRSIAWTLDGLAAWGTRLEADDGWARAYGGSVDAPVGAAWLRSEDAAVRLIAVAAHARSGGARASLGELLSALDDPVPVNRVFASFAVERVTGVRIDPELFDVTASAEVRARQLEALRQKLR